MREYYDAVVIGSGLGGLTAGALFAHAGQEVLVLERNKSFGGAATTYHRGNMTVEASLHRTTDPRTTPDPKGQIFDALDLYHDVEFVPVEEFYEVRSPLFGKPITIPTDFDRLTERLIDRFPNEADSIERFVHQIQSVQNAIGVFVEKHDGIWWLAHGPELPFRLWPVLRDMKASLSDVMTRYFGDNEAIKLALCGNLSYYSDDPDRMWWLLFAVAQGGFVNGGGNYLKGGSSVLTEKLVDRIRTEGGNVLAGQSAESILIDDAGHVYGVGFRPTEGGDHQVAYAPVVFGNAAPHAIAPMLPEEFRDSFMEPYLENALSTSLFSMTFGLSRLPSDLGIRAYSTMLLPSWMTKLDEYRDCAGLLAELPGERLPVLGVVDYSRIDSGLVKGELHPVNVVGVDRLENWHGLDEAEYRSRTTAWLDAVQARLDEEWPGFACAVSQREIATARTMHEKLNTPNGAVYGFAPDVPAHLMTGGPPRSPRTSIHGLWLASAYAGIGGFSGAIGAGGSAARSALHESGGGGGEAVALDHRDEVIIDASPAEAFRLIVDEMDAKTDWWAPHRVGVLLEGSSFAEVGALLSATIFGTWPVLYMTRTVETVENERICVTYVRGPLTGQGTWYFDQVGSKTRVGFHWEMKPVGSVATFLSPLRPVVKIHSDNMRVGFESLMRYLEEKSEPA